VLPLSYGPILAYLDVWYRSTIPDAFHKAGRAQEMAHYCTGLRIAFENELSGHKSEELAAGSWRSVVLQEWACREIRVLGHSSRGRTSYRKALEKENKRPYEEDVLELRKLFFSFCSQTYSLTTISF
jgi:hypothetical protein